MVCTKIHKALVNCFDFFWGDYFAIRELPIKLKSVWAAALNNDGWWEEFVDYLKLRWCDPVHVGMRAANL